jgi:hypothetical protein
MSKLTEYTIEVYKADRRIKKDERYGRNRVGLRFVNVIDFIPSTKSYIDIVVANIREQGFVVEVFETFVTRTNMMSGKEYKERYDTPYYCSPSSETFWSN